MMWSDVKSHYMMWSDVRMSWYDVVWNDVIKCSVSRLSHVILLRCPPCSLPSFPTPACPASSNDEVLFHNVCKSLLQKKQDVAEWPWFNILHIAQFKYKSIYIYILFYHFLNRHIMFLAGIVIAHWGLKLVFPAMEFKNCCEYRTNQGRYVSVVLAWYTLSKFVERAP